MSLYNIRVMNSLATSAWTEFSTNLTLPSTMVWSAVCSVCLSICFYLLSMGHVCLK